MTLRLSPEDQAEYNRRCAINQKAKEEAIAAGDTCAAKKARQAITWLYQEFQLKQLPVLSQSPPWTTEERVACLEARIARLEANLIILLGETE